MMGHVFPRSSIRNSPRRSPAHAGRSRVGDPENGGRFTVKKYHSAKIVSEDAWQALPLPIQNSKSTIQNYHPLLPLNPDYDPITVEPHEAPEMMVLGEWVSSIE